MLTDGTKEILLAVSSGLAIRFKEEDVRPMGLIAAGVNGVKLGVGDEVVGAEVMPAKGEIFLIATDGKAKRVPIRDFPTQGRYGRGVIAWQLPKGVNLAGTASGKPNAVATVHLLNQAPKSTRLDAAPIRKRAAVRGESAVEVKAGDTITVVVMGWEVENFVNLVEEKKPVTSSPQSLRRGKGKKTPAKRKPAAKKSAAISSSKGRRTTAKRPTTKAKPVATSSPQSSRKGVGKKPTSRKTTERK